MEKRYEEVTEKRLRYLVSSDGEFQRYVYNLSEDSEEYKRKVKEVEEYESSLRCLLTSEVMAIPHMKYTADDYLGASFVLDATNCCEDDIYIFKIRIAEEMERIFKWCHALTGEAPQVGKSITEVKFCEDGTPRDNIYLSVFADEHGVYHNEKFEPEYFVGHYVVVQIEFDHEWANIIGTLEDIQESRKKCQEKVLVEIEKQIFEESAKSKKSK